MTMFRKARMKLDGYFNSHPHEEDDIQVCVIIRLCDISTHILMKRMTICINAIKGDGSFQLTSSWRGWHPLTYPSPRYHHISTHILMKRMTIRFILPDRDNGISTHILMKRMTKSDSSMVNHVSYFNSHPHEEDDGEEYANYVPIIISTHILMKRMTIWQYRLKKGVLFQLTSSWRGWQLEKRGDIVGEVFQLTSSWRGWRGLTSVSLFRLVFQLTSSWRGWQISANSSDYQSHFNSHPHEEDDHNPSGYAGYIVTFQLTSSWRGWLAALGPVFSIISISTHILMKRMTDVEQKRI